MKKFVSFMSIFMLVFHFADIQVSALDVSAKSAVVIDFYSGEILFEKAAHEKRGMASTTKIMTALIAIENLNPDDIITVSPFAAGTEGSSIWLSEGEHMTVNDMLYGLLLSSGNDAACALAEHTAGTVEAFTILMNKRAKEIGAYNTNFTNPHGLPDEEHYTTAYDLALISREAMKNEKFREIVKTKNKTISWENSQWKRSLSNHNKLLKMYEYSTGIKTGFTKKDGRCLVSGAKKDNLEIITVTLSAPDDWNDHINLSDYCFESFKTDYVCKKGNIAGRFIPSSNAEPIGLVFKSDFYTTLKKEESAFLDTKITCSVVLPVEKGGKVGEYSIYENGTLIGKVDLIAANDSAVKVTFKDIIIELMKGLMMQ